jgi:hypothetical protein
MMQQIQNYNRKDFDENSFNSQGKIFTDLIARWEREFHDEFKPFYANHLFGNYATMRLVKNCFSSEELMNYGMDGDYDFETNLKIDRNRAEPVVYAIGSGIPENEDEPLFISEDTSFADGVVILKYIPENDGDDDITRPVENDGELIEILIESLEKK